MRVTIYDPVDNSAIAAGTLTSARTDHTATLLKDGRVLVVGGITADGLVSSDIEVFDPATGTSTIGGAPARAEKWPCCGRTPRWHRAHRGRCDRRRRPAADSGPFRSFDSQRVFRTGPAAQRSRSCFCDDAARRARPRGGRQQRDGGSRVRRNLLPPTHRVSRSPRRR